MTKENQETKRFGPCMMFMFCIGVLEFDTQARLTTVSGLGSPWQVAVITQKLGFLLPARPCILKL